MRSLLLMTILFATVAIPAMAARDRNPARGLKKTVVYMFLFNIAYMLACRFIYHRLP